MASFPAMTKIIPETERGPLGTFYIEHKVCDREASRRSAMGGRLSYVPEGTYCVMKEVGCGDESWDTVWMSDTPLEHQTNYSALSKAKGDVLVVGLGLGMLSLAMCRKKEVRSVTVLELEPEVVCIVAPHVRHKKLQLIVADGRQPPLRSRHFDFIYVDIWPNICSDNWLEMKPMLATYRRHRRVGGIVDGWMKDYVQKEHNRPGW